MLLDFTSFYVYDKRNEVLVFMNDHNFFQASETGRRDYLQTCKADNSGLYSISCEERVWQ